MTFKYRPIPVWSRNQRVIHWIIAFSVLLLIPLGAFLFSSDFIGIPEESRDSIMDVHAAVGFVFAAGLFFRIIYLFTGPPASSWRDVLPLRKEQIKLGVATGKYYLSGFKGKAPLYFSHNPLAGLFDAIVFLFGLTQAISGLLIFFFHEEGEVNGAVNHAHAATANGAGHGSDMALIIHAIGALVIIGFVISHFTALAIHDILERRGLVSSMISGNKFFDEEEVRELEFDIKAKTGRAPQ
ncbi:MAG: cytochrome b/b6 domain-containing protein [Deltaproteobacteria bacterium]|nr:cytochrome b/b6 domain-containing protein [Deltaproteobacteria bacterium]